MDRGCIQAQQCHAGNCPTGVATQDPLRQRANNVPGKAERVANFHRETLNALAELAAAARSDGFSPVDPLKLAAE
jgi:glutamate synthase domain-containing protein 2